MKKQVLTDARQCDVIVIGTGIAGVVAAIAAAKQGQDVILCSGSQMFSGSSFYPGTWGLGVIAPEDRSDEEDLAETILKVGCHMADEQMVRCFVSDLLPTMNWLEELGIKFMEAGHADEREFIPCFDHKHRRWRGLLADNARETFTRVMSHLPIRQMPGYEVIELVEKNQKITGVIASHSQKGIGYTQCKACVLATGGYAGLYGRRLTASDVCGTGQYLALMHGAALVNMEYMQMMPGYTWPCSNTVFNEKTFRYVRMKECTNQKLLEQRSGYGPFTSRLASAEIDYILARGEAEGTQIQYITSLKENMPEFVRTYFDWLAKEKHVTPWEPMRIQMFAHAANGGIKIDENGFTGKKGLYACGEVTGGMHGADRIGGLSTANGFVFGKRAGEAAAEYAAEQTIEYVEEQAVGKLEFDMWAFDDPDGIRKQLQELMTKAAFVIRTENQLNYAIKEIEKLTGCKKKEYIADGKQVMESRKVQGQMVLALGILRAELLRKESRGSHYREDYPKENVQFQKRILINQTNGITDVHFEGEVNVQK